jgi:hypothetical protein
MAIWLKILLGFVVGFFAGGLTASRVKFFWSSFAEKRRLKATVDRASNVIGELVLPTPDDPRWRGVPVSRHLGCIRVENGQRLFISGKQAPLTPPFVLYCEAVIEHARREKLDRLIAKVDSDVANYNPDDSSKTTKGKTRP